MRFSLYKQMEKRLSLLAPGSVISVADFVDFAAPKTVSKMLTRLQEAGKIDRVLRSIFWIPDGVSDAPKPHLVAEALARENGWDLMPSNETALVEFGLREEAPLVWTYVTNGTNRSYRYGDHTISFTHTSSRAMAYMTKKTRMLVQCVRAYGKEHLSEEALMKLVEKIREWDFKKLKEETENAARWVRLVVLKMCRLARKVPSTEQIRR